MQLIRFCTAKVVINLAAIRLAQVTEPYQKRGKAISRKTTYRRTIWPKASNDGHHRTLSNSLFERHETGSAIQRLMSDSCQPEPLVLIFS